MGIRLTSHFLQGNPRSTAIRAVAKANDLDLEIVHTEPAKGVDTDYLKLNKLGKVPTFEGKDGFILTECIAIAVYGKSGALHGYPANPRYAHLMMRHIIIQLSLSEITC